MCVRKQDSSITISTLRAMRGNRKTYGIAVKDESVLEVFGQAAPVERTSRNEIIGFITMRRVMIGIMILPIAAASCALAGGQIYAQLFLFLLVAFLVAVATNIINDLTGIERELGGNAG